MAKTNIFLCSQVMMSFTVWACHAYGRKRREAEVSQIFLTPAGALEEIS